MSDHGATKKSEMPGLFTLVDRVNNRGITFRYVVCVIKILHNNPGNRKEDATDAEISSHRSG